MKKDAPKKDIYRVKRAPVIDTEIMVPGDKSISHRSIMLAALSNGVCKITNFLEGEDCRSTAKAFRQLGITIEEPEPQTIVVHGQGGKLTAPTEDIDCGNSGTTMRLMSGILAAQPFTSRLIGDASLSKRPMKRVIEPLTQMGAKFTAEGEGNTPPLVIHGGPLKAITYQTPVPSAQIKSAIMLAGLFASGVTTVIESAPSRDHTERMLEYFFVRLREEKGGKNHGAKEQRISLLGGQKLESRDFAVPGDISSAAFWLVAAAAQPGSRLLVKNVGLNPTRTGIIGVLIRMGARIREVVETSKTEQGESAGVIDVKGGQLRGTIIAGAEIPNVIDEIPILAVAGALASGETFIRDAKELRVKETDRLAAIATNLRSMGAKVEEHDDGLTITGGKKLKGARLKSFGDHRIAMAFAIAGLFATGETIIEDIECVQTSYPGFDETLRVIQKGTGFLHRTTPVISSLSR